MKIYVASSWRNTIQPDVVQALRAAGHEVYDFRNPGPGLSGFAWASIDPDWQEWTTDQYRAALEHPIARSGFALDFNAMKEADAGVMVLPCGRSANIEAGWIVGQCKPLWILQTERQEPELMYAMAAGICGTIKELLRSINAATDRSYRRRHLNTQIQADRANVDADLVADVLRIYVDAAARSSEGKERAIDALAAALVSLGERPEELADRILNLRPAATEP